MKKFLSVQIFQLQIFFGNDVREFKDFLLNSSGDYVRVQRYR